MSSRHESAKATHLEAVTEALADHLLTPEEAAQALRISPRKLWALKASGEISHIRIGRLVRYPAASVTKFIERAMQDASS